MGTFRFGAICVYKRKEIPPQIFGGGFSKLYQVTPQTQLSRPITLGHQLRGVPTLQLIIIEVTQRPRGNDLGHTYFFVGPPLAT